MVGVIILYDHVHPVGAFAVKAAIDVRRQRVKLLLMMSSSFQMKSSIKLIKEHPKIAESLLNAQRLS